MMNRTKIEWVKNPDGTQGYTWNPITGCLNGCDYCYARKLANGRLKQRYLANRNIAWEKQKPIYGDKLFDIQAYRNPFYPRFWPDRRLEPMQSRFDKKGKGIFVCDMSDLFGIGVPEEWTRQVFATINCCPDHRFYLLTKQPQNLVKWSPFPDNCWVGVSITDNNAYYNTMFDSFTKIKAKLKYISFEPLLELPFAVSASTGGVVFAGDLKYAGISWVIIGAQTRPYKPPQIEWVKEIVEACDSAGIPVFLKDNLRHMGDISFQVGYLRQELPHEK